MRDHNTQKIITLKETGLTVTIADFIISEGLSFNISWKPRSNEVIELARNVSKCYHHPNIKIIPKDLLNVIHDQNMERNLISIKKESDIFGFLFLGDDATISRILLFNILVSGGIAQLRILELVDCQCN